MVNDFSMPIKIVPVATSREPSGLALSSRNGYLTPEEKRIAPNLYQSIRWLAEKISHCDDFDNLITQTIAKINQAGLHTDYLHICHANTLQIATKQDKELVILAAAHCGKARLIDNIQLSRA